MEIIGNNFFCNLGEVHLNQISPTDFAAQEDAFHAAAISVAVLLNHKFTEPRYQYSRELDPIVGVSFTGLFDFFVNAFGVDWLRWWEQGRSSEFYGELPQNLIPIANDLHVNLSKFAGEKFNLGNAFKAIEAAYLNYWRTIVEDVVWDYCDRHRLKRPNRCTTCQPAGCLDRTAIRVFDQGLLYADEIVNANSGETIGLGLAVRSGVKCNSAIANNLLSLSKIALKNGRILYATQNHRFSIGDRWVRVDEMQPGMKIDFSIGEYKNEQDVLLVSSDKENYTRSYRSVVVGHSRGVLSQIITTPVTCNPTLGYFLGLLFGNGCLSESKNRIRFSHQDKEILAKILVIGKNLFDLDGSFYTDKRGSKHEVSFNSLQLYDWLKINGLAKTQKSKELERIPEPVRRSSKETILAFFAGLIDSDGCVRSDGALSIDSASEEWIRNLQQVAECVGLSFSIYHNTQGDSYQSVRSIWGLCLSRMLSKTDSLNYLNETSIKCQRRPIKPAKRNFKFNPYEVIAIEHDSKFDYSYDFAVEGIDDDDSWYWQGCLKSHNTKSLLTGASPGCHPPKAARFIRRVTFAKNDPVALACKDLGFNVIPAQSDKDENGNLLNDPFDPQCTEWLVEFPTQAIWASLPGADEIDISRFSALAQLEFFMQVQKHYVRHNTSATIELRENEIEALGNRIYEAIRDDEGYISAALLARFDDLQTFPRLPFEPIDKTTYDRLSEEVAQRQTETDFSIALAKYDNQQQSVEAQGPAGCDSDKCLFEAKK